MTRPRSLAVGFAVLAATLTVAFAGDLLGELGFTEHAARERVFQAFVGGSVSPSGNIAVFKGSAPDRRVLFVKAVTAFAKTFAQTDQFRKMYADYREANRPSAASGDTKAFDELMAAQAKEIEQSLAGMKEVMKTLPPDQQKEMQQQIDQMRKQMEANRKNPEMKAAYEQSAKAEAAANAEDHKRRLKEWETNYPPSADQLIANRLREFLDETKDVDYGAKLVAQYGKMRFANAPYEQKSAEWKMCFRAGKEATEAARALAAEWLKELQAKGLR
jgi:hypothetical protein